MDRGPYGTLDAERRVLPATTRRQIERHEFVVVVHIIIGIIKLLLHLSGNAAATAGGAPPVRRAKRQWRRRDGSDGDAGKAEIKEIRRVRGAGRLRSGRRRLWSVPRHPCDCGVGKDVISGGWQAEIKYRENGKDLERLSSG